MTALEAWNRAPAREANKALLSCCGSPAWAEALVARRPYATLDALLADAETTWFAQPEPEWLTAFACHPRIGEKQTEAASTEAFAASSIAEQAAAQASLDEAVAQALIAGNRLYEQKFGFLYIVFASGRSAPELLHVLEARLQNDRATELLEAARQQWCITHLRITRWLP
jgi:OHCU decarboxylase